jgi:hypothetical protein
MEIEEIVHVLQDQASGLRERIVRDVGLFTVGLLRVSQTAQGERLYLSGTGTGTLVWFAGAHYILTAAHVWEELCRGVAPASVGLTLRENLDHKYLIDRAAIVATGPPSPAEWGEWGPDIVFLRVPPAHVGAIEVHRVFWNLARKLTLAHVICIDLRVLMGTPEQLGQLTDIHADLQITGLFSTPVIERYSSLQAPEAIRRDYDYVDLDMDLTLPGVPQTFGGVSGGGLWRVLVYWSDTTNEITWKKDIEGVAFHESDIINGHRTVRCHGPQSISMGVHLLI